MEFLEQIPDAVMKKKKCLIFMPRVTVVSKYYIYMFDLYSLYFVVYIFVN